MNKLETIVEVHQLKKQGFRVAAIARKCNLSRTTVYEYLDKDFEEALEWVEILKTRSRKLDPYQKQILSWLKEHPDLSASQISYWLEERCSFSDVGESTVRTYVRELRDKYHIPKTLTYRTYEEIEELPPVTNCRWTLEKRKLKRLKGNGEKFMSLPLCSLIRDISMRNGRNILLLHVMCCVLMRTPLSFMEEEQKRSFMTRIS